MTHRRQQAKQSTSPMSSSVSEVDASRLASMGNQARKEEVLGRVPPTSGGGLSVVMAQLRRSAACLGLELDDYKIEFGKKNVLDGVDAEASYRERKLTFASNSPSPESIAHELIHAKQAAQNGVSGSTDLSQPEEGAEKEAEALGPKVAAGQATSVHMAAGKGLMRRVVKGKRKQRENTDPKKEMSENKNPFRKKNTSGKDDPSRVGLGSTGRCGVSIKSGVPIYDLGGATIDTTSSKGATAAAEQAVPVYSRVRDGRLFLWRIPRTMFQEQPGTYKGQPVDSAYVNGWVDIANIENQEEILKELEKEGQDFEKAMGKGKGVSQGSESGHKEEDLSAKVRTFKPEGSDFGVDPLHWIALSPSAQKGDSEGGNHVSDYLPRRGQINLCMNVPGSGQKGVAIDSLNVASATFRRAKNVSSITIQVYDSPVKAGRKKAGTMKFVYGRAEQGGKNVWGWLPWEATKG